ncbi:hypothetical protein [Massilia sp.]|uniref:hypothetical protein n=1 Tax=Massilia sp. TaxID=1882437 RepID=UPI0028B098B2|nr:hypothetical protein [Massilia sp.]
MSITINTLVHRLRERLAQAGSPISLGHTHQLLAAARGYTSLAVLQASNEPVDLDQSMHWIVDVPQLRERAVSLAVTINADLFTQLLVQTSHEFDDGPHIHASHADLAEHFVMEAQEAALDDSDVAREMANTNCTGPWEEHLEFVGSSFDTPAEVGTLFKIDYEGHVQGEQDRDRPYSGHSVNVSVELRFGIVGKRLFAGPPDIEVVGASLDHGYYDEDDGAPSMALSELEAIAIELGIPVEQQDELEGAEVGGDTTSAGVPNGYVVDIKYCASSPVIDQLRKQHPTQQIWVLGNTLERINRFE